MNEEEHLTFTEVGELTGASRQMVARLSCASKKPDPLRGRVCQGLAGGLLSRLRFGLNLPFCPAVIARATAVEPSDVSWDLAGERLRATNGPVRRSGLDGQSLPFADDPAFPRTRGVAPTSGYAVGNDASPGAEAIWCGKARCAISAARTSLAGRSPTRLAESWETAVAGASLNLFVPDRTGVDHTGARRRIGLATAPLASVSCAL
jgi:hypothetical protein